MRTDPLLVELVAGDPDWSIGVQPERHIAMARYREWLSDTTVGELAAWRNVMWQQADERRLLREGRAPAVRVNEPSVGVISTRDGVPAPATAKEALRCLALAESSGWQARLGYAWAQVPDRWYENGNLATAAHALESVGLYAVRGRFRLAAFWHSTNGGSWSFESAWCGDRSARSALGWQESKKNAGTRNLVRDRIRGFAGAEKFTTFLEAKNAEENS